MKSRVIAVKEGFSNHYIMHGVGSLVLSLIAFYFSNLPALAFVVIAVILFLAVTGIEVDLTKLQYRKYKTLLGFIKFGRWKQFSKDDSFHLVLSSESARFFAATYPVLAPGNFYNGNKSKSTTFDIVRISKSKKKTMVNEFLKYESAKQTLSLFHQAGCSVRNKIAEKIHHNKSRRK